jgi:small subunit ribosomal protein S4
MTKRITAKHKIDRRLGLNLWGRVKSPFNRRQSRPGQHGTRGRKLSDFGIHLMAKQKLKGYYANLSERQFRRFFEEAQRRKGDTSENLIGLLERRLDTVVYRAKFVPTMFAARQFVNHGHVQVNGRRVNIGSYLVNDNDVITVREKSQQLTSVLGSIESQERDVPEYLEINHKTMTCKYLRAPKMVDVPYPVQMEPNLVVEYYSQ